MRKFTKELAFWRIAPVAVLCLLLVAAGFVFSGSQEQRMECDQCNVVYISVDPMAVEHMSAYGYERNTTPNIDRLAEDSFVFTHAFSQSSHTTPSLYSTFSSTYPSEHGVREGSRADGNVTLLAEFLNERGYYTFSTNSGTATKGELGFDQGFDRYSEHYVNESHHKRYHKENGTREEFIKRQIGNAQGNFFLFYQSMGTHDPYLVSDQYRMYGPELPSFRNKSRKLWDRLKENYSDAEAYPRFRDYYFGKASENETIRRFIVSQYDASLRRADSDIGGVIETLKSQGEYEDSIIIINAQHGEQFGDHGKWRHATSLYNEAINVPLIIHFPGQEEGRRVDSYAGNIDVFPTVADSVASYISPSLRSQWRGKSLLPFISGEKNEYGAVFSESLDMTAFMHGSASIKRYENSSGVFYFNLSSDFEERNPLEGIDEIEEVESAYQDFLNRIN